jgi:broad specificity phosphatase PhoE
MEKRYNRGVMKVILLRHGETVANRRGLILGQRDYPLTALGITTTKSLADAIGAKYLRPLIDDSANLRIDHPRGAIFSSPLGRAKASAAIFAGKTGWQTILLEGMAELACGEWEGRIRKEVAPDRPTIRATWTEFPPGGESYQSASARVEAAIDRIQAVEGIDLALVVGHGSVNRLFLKIWLDLDPYHAMTINQRHDVAYVVGEDKEVYWVTAEGQTGQGTGTE